MREIPAFASPAPRGLLGAFKSWWQFQPGGIRPPAESLAGGTVGPNGYCIQSLRVLAVDDDPVNLLTISALLASRGLVPVLATNGAEAVSLACEKLFDLILMDLQMPILDGLGATSAIRRFETQSARPAVPVIAYSSASPGASVLALHGFNGRLIKPCDDQELEDCLVRWCPAYRAAPTARGGDHGNSGWALASRHPGTGSASLR